MVFISTSANQSDVTNPFITTTSVKITLILNRAFHNGDMSFKLNNEAKRVNQFF